MNRLGLVLALHLSRSAVAAEALSPLRTRVSPSRFSLQKVLAHRDVHGGDAPNEDRGKFAFLDVLAQRLVEGVDALTYFRAGYQHTLGGGNETDLSQPLVDVVTGVPAHEFVPALEEGGVDVEALVEQPAAVLVAAGEPAVEKGSDEGYQSAHGSTAEEGGPHLSGHAAGRYRWPLTGAR